MTIRPGGIVVAVLLLAGCAQREQLACGPALPPIGQTAAVGTAEIPPGFRPIAPVAAPAPTPAPVVMQAPVAAPAPTMPDNIAAVGGR